MSWEPRRFSDHRLTRRCKELEKTFRALAEKRKQQPELRLPGVNAPFPEVPKAAKPMRPSKRRFRSVASHALGLTNQHKT